MITQYTTINAEKYDELFAKASEALNTEPIYVPAAVASENDFQRNILDGIIYYTKNGEEYSQIETGAIFNPLTQYYVQASGIQTLEQYFCHLKDLMELPNGYKYIMLPLDEPPLDINANTRAINVPNNFKTSGLSVEGDELAETLFFRIDRYFDAMDLSTCEIFVQWLLPDKKTTYATVIYMIDVESEPGKLIFACPLTSDITENAGAIELSVRFIKRGVGNEIVYSFNTLPARATISSTMKFDVNTIQQVSADKVKNLFALAIENSDKASGEPAAAPVFDLLLGGAGATLNSVTEKYLDENKECTLTISADATPAGEITYEWFRLSGINGWPVKIDNSGSTYTIKAEQLTDIDDEDYTEKTVTGVYQVRATNRISDKSAKAWSDKAILVAPTKVELEDLSNGVLGEDAITLTATPKVNTNPSEMIPHYTWHYTAPDATESEEIGFLAELEPNQEGYYKVVFGAELNGDIAYSESNEIKVTNEPIAVEFIGEAARNNVVTWNVNDASRGSKIDLAKDDTLIQAPALGAFTSDGITYEWFIDANGDGNLDELEISLTEEGGIDAPVLDVSKLTNNQVRCVATNKLNGRVAKSVSALYVIASYLVE